MSTSGMLGEKEPVGIRHAIFGAVLGLLMIVLAFVGIASSDVAALGNQGYWTMLTVVYAVASLLMDWLHSKRSFHMTWTIGQLALLWIGVFVAIQLVYFFITTGRFANADTGLVNGLILALGTFICGVYVNWRLMVVGVALAFATVAAAYVEEYLWVLLGVALLAVALLVVGSRLTASRRQMRLANEMADDLGGD